MRDISELEVNLIFLENQNWPINSVYLNVKSKFGFKIGKFEL